MLGANVDFLPSVRIFLSFLSSLFRAPPRQICEKFLRPVTPCSESFAPFRVKNKVSPMLDQAPCGPAVPCLSRQARAAVMVRLRGEADAGHRSAVSGHRSPVKRVIGRQCHSGVSVIRVNTGMVNFRKFLLPNKAVIFLKIFREIYICPKLTRPAVLWCVAWVASATEMSRPGRTLFDFSWAIICPREGGGAAV